MVTAPATEVAAYWNQHPHGSQFLRDGQVEIGSPEFFAQIRPYMDCYRFPYIMDRIDVEAGKLRGQHLLEIGCGLGFDAVEFLKRGVRVTATDLTPANVELAGRHFDLEGLRAEAVQVEDVFHMSFEDDAFDAVYCNGVLGHTGEPARAVREIYRVLKPGGRAIICHMYRQPSVFYALSKLDSKNVIAIGHEVPPVTHFFADDEIRAIFKDYHIQQIDVEHYRLIPSIRSGMKGWLFSHVLRPGYNLLPEAWAKRWANKLSVIAIKPA